MAAKVRVKGGVRRNPRGRGPLVLLREEYARASGSLKVDHEAGVIFGVKVVGLDSANTHGVDGATAGTVYTPEALRNAIPLYEGVAVNVNHPDRGKPKADRSSYDRFGKLVNVRFERDGLYADLHLLKTHPMAQRVMEAAERMPDLFGLSHNAYGRGDVRSGRYVITEIPEVRSVDLVADPGSNTSLFESRERRTMKTIREIFESAAPKIRAKLRKLLEMYEDDGDGAADLPAEEPASPSLEDHLGSAILAIMQAVKAGDMDPEEGKKKVLAAYKLAMDEPKEEEAPVEEDDEDGKGAGTGEEEGADDGDLEKPKKAQESRRRKAPRGAVRLTESWARSLCELAGVEPAAELLESLVALGHEQKAVKHLRYIKGLAPRGQKPRTQHVYESRESGESLVSVRDIKDGKAFAQLLRRGLN